MTEVDAFTGDGLGSAASLILGLLPRTAHLCGQVAGRPVAPIGAVGQRQVKVLEDFNLAVRDKGGDRETVLRWSPGGGRRPEGGSEPQAARQRRSNRSGQSSIGTGRLPVPTERGYRWKPESA